MINTKENLCLTILDIGVVQWNGRTSWMEKRMYLFTKCQISLLVGISWEDARQLGWSQMSHCSRSWWTTVRTRILVSGLNQ